MTLAKTTRRGAHRKQSGNRSVSTRGGQSGREPFLQLVSCHQPPSRILLRAQVPQDLPEHSDGSPWGLTSLTLRPPNEGSLLHYHLVSGQDSRQQAWESLLAALSPQQDCKVLCVLPFSIWGNRFWERKDLPRAIELVCDRAGQGRPRAGRGRVSPSRCPLSVGAHPWESLAGPGAGLCCAVL